MRPLRLEANLPHRFYRGGAAIARFRGEAETDGTRPEDWVGSTTAVRGSTTAGLTRLSDDRTLRDAVLADPEAYLGAEHRERFGADPALLVKLLDAGERLPVHCHPSRDFARRHLDCPYGKTEAWVVIEARGERPSVHLGFRHDVEAETLAGWVERQETATMLRALNALRVEPGDSVLVPAGVPHAIGEGVFVVELQEPTDLSVLLEWEGFDVDGPAEGHLGLGFDVALACVDRSGWGAERLAGLRRVDAEAPEVRPGVRVLLPREADPYFRAERLRPRPAAALEAGFSILVVLGGGGLLETEHGGSITVRGGETLLVPYSAGAGRLSGAMDAVRCLPPRPSEAAG